MDEELREQLRGIESGEIFEPHFVRPILARARDCLKEDTRLHWLAERAFVEGWPDRDEE
ncbi:MAG: hypothetical protein JNG90_00685 [Planctomycetaceae bacterium]|nr:hypothetical protein [Planctomycetaceae bacterium]